MRREDGRHSDRQQVTRTNQPRDSKNLTKEVKINPDPACCRPSVSSMNLNAEPPHDHWAVFFIRPHPRPDKEPD